MRRRDGHEPLRLPQAPIDLLEPRQEPGQRARADRDVLSHPDVEPAQLSGNQPRPRLGVRVFDPQQIVREVLTELSVDLEDALDTNGPTPR